MRKTFEGPGMEVQFLINLLTRIKVFSARKGATLDASVLEIFSNSAVSDSPCIGGASYRF
jgi:hypothetical protein